MTRLNTCDCIVELLQRRSHLLPSGRQVNDFVAVDHASHRADDRRRAAETGATVTVTDSLDEVVGADVVITDFKELEGLL